MPILRNNTILEIARGLKVFMRLETGVTRGAVPAKETADTDRRVKQFQNQLSQKDQKIAALNEELSTAKSLTTSSESTDGDSDTRTPIFFVFGNPRSGTNWLMRTLNAHPEIVCRGEGRFFGRYFGRAAERKNLKDMQTGEHIRHKIQPASLYNAIADSEYLRLWIERSVWTRDGDADEHVKDMTREAIYYFLSKGLSGTGARMVGDKTPLNQLHLMQEVAEIVPEARVVNAVRDGRDVLVSQMHHLWNRGADEGGVWKLSEVEQSKRDRYREDPQGFLDTGESIFDESRMRSLSSQWSSRLANARKQGPRLLGDNYNEVRYERLLEDPEKEFGRIFGFLGASNEEKLVKRCTRATSFAKRSGGRTSGQENTRSGARKGIAGDWKNVFTDQDKEIFKEEAGDLLVELGYEDNHNW